MSIPFQSQAIGALKPGFNRHLSSMGPQAISETAKTNKKAFTINWDGASIDYDFASKSSIIGIILLEVQSAKELPKVKNCTSIPTLVPVPSIQT